jgi:hypothetical protein
MKSKEEIEQLADNFYPLVTTDLICSPKLVRDGYFKGYTQCQEDNADKKYTEEDVIHLMFNASNWDTFKEGEVGYDMSLSEYIQHCLQKLNKQD